MKFTFCHNNFNVLNLEKSLEFYEKALGFCIGSAIFGVFVAKLGYTTTWIGVLVCVAIAFASLIISAIGMTKLNKERMEKLKNENKANIA